MTTYRGYRSANGDAHVLVEDGSLCAPLTHVVKHSPGGFEWGYGGSGPADLARSILIDALNAPQCSQCDGEGCWNCDAGILDISPSMYQNFKFDKVASLPTDGWRLAKDDVLAWVDSYRKDHGLDDFYHCHRCNAPIAHDSTGMIQEEDVAEVYRKEWPADHPNVLVHVECIEGYEMA